MKRKLHLSFFLPLLEQLTTTLEESVYPLSLSLSTYVRDDLIGITNEKCARKSIVAIYSSFECVNSNDEIVVDKFVSSDVLHVCK